MARVGLGRLEYLMERMDRNIDLEGSDVIVNSLISDTGLTATAGGVTVTAGGVGVTAGGIAVAAGGIGVTAGGVNVTAGGVNVVAGRIREGLGHVNVDARHHILRVADVNAGILVHTSETGAGTLTMPVAADIIGGVTGSGQLVNNGDCVKVYYINDGNQTVTVAADSGATCTINNAANTILTNEGATLLLRRTSGTALTVYILA